MNRKPSRLILAEKGDIMTIKKLRTLAKMTQREFSEYLNIPFRTIQDWEYEKRIPPSYVVELIEFRLRAEGII